MHARGRFPLRPLAYLDRLVINEPRLLAAIQRPSCSLSFQTLRSSRSSSIPQHGPDRDFLATHQPNVVMQVAKAA